MSNPFEIYSTIKDKYKTELSFDEYSIDTASRVSEVFEDPGSYYGFKVLWYAVLLFFAIVAVRLVYLQIIQHNQLQRLSETNRLRTTVLLAPRGFVFDRTGKKVADNTASFNLVATPADLPVDGLKEEISRLANIISIDPEAVFEKLKKIDRTSYQTIPLKYGITQEEKLKFEAGGEAFLGLGLETVPVRNYNPDYAMASVLGYTGLVTENEADTLSSEYRHPRDQIGKTGVEKQYDSLLRGINGYRQVQVNSRGLFVSEFAESEPLPGANMELTVDAELSQKIHQFFEEQAEDTKGAAVVMNAKTGEVLSLISVPSFKSNDLVSGKAAQDPEIFDQLFNNKSLPLFNRALAGTYPPGSTVKPLIATAALMYGVVTDKTIINDTGIIRIPNQYDPSIVYSFRGWKRSGLGPMDVYSAIAESSDIFFYAVAGGLPGSTMKSLGPFGVADSLRLYNLGSVTAIDLPGEKKGLVPDPDWKMEYYDNDPIKGKWYVGDTYHIGIGQGDMLVTPLQMAVATSAVASNGVAHRPYVVKRILNSIGKVVYEHKPKVLFTHPASNEVFKIAQNGMRRTVVNGSAKKLAELSVECSGKTGTSQFDDANPDKYHAWFTAFCPLGGELVTMTVLVEAGGEGSAAAVPIVKKTMEWLIENRYNK
ncbi:MAG TPA: penicillin-binding protein 2 [Patescibacteria group bacterium]|nr:penicillin-binding protein 2 [Patescibacteria group bacterium]